MQHLLAYCIGMILLSLPMSMIPHKTGTTSTPKSSGTAVAPVNQEVRQAESSDLHLYAALISETPTDNAPEPPQSDEDENILSAKNIRIINLGPIINIDGRDFAPTISADGKTLYYVSRRQGSKNTAGGDPSDDFWAAKKADRYDTVFNKPFNIDTSTVYGDLGVNTSLH